MTCILSVQGAAYAIGNASYHSGQLYPRLKTTIPALVELLRDPQTKTRANAASKTVSVCLSVCPSVHPSVCHLSLSFSLSLSLSLSFLSLSLSLFVGLHTHSNFFSLCFVPVSFSELVKFKKVRVCVCVRVCLRACTACLYVPVCFLLNLWSVDISQFLSCTVHVFVQVPVAI